MWRRRRARTRGSRTVRSRRLPAPGGRLFVEVPNAETNPFEYLVADHATHFTPSTLGRLAAGAGWIVDELSAGWVSKELSMVAHPAEGPVTVQTETADNVGARVRAH